MCCGIVNKAQLCRKVRLHNSLSTTAETSTYSTDITTAIVNTVSVEKNVTGVENGPVIVKGEDTSIHVCVCVF